MLKNTLKIVLIACSLSTLSACTKETPCPEANYNLPSGNAINACNPAKGGSQAACLALSNSDLIGVAVSRGIGPNNGTTVAPNGDIAGTCTVVDMRTSSTAPCQFYMYVQALPWPVGQGSAGAGTTGCVDTRTSQSCSYTAAYEGQVALDLRTLINGGQCGNF